MSVKESKYVWPSSTAANIWGKQFLGAWMWMPWVVERKRLGKCDPCLV